MQPINNRRFFCSWSGGKDSCLALYHAMQQGGRPQCLLTIMTEDGMRSRSHGLPKSLLEEQARSLGVPIVFRSASWAEYETVFVSALRELKQDGINTGVFGDIDIDSHREWVVRVCAIVDITPFHPLWKRDRCELLEEFIALGFKAVIVVVKGDKLDRGFLGRSISIETIRDLKNAGVDASGELGEYHTVLTDGPIFSSRIMVRTKRQVRHEEYWFQEVALEHKLVR
ncbi:MAG: diphthine--ammonia ligase [Lentisphaerae bacterium]|nr:diphthine--ammonia ligase [Lentisphaerota bacterium]